MQKQKPTGSGSGWKELPPQAREWLVEKAVDDHARISRLNLDREPNRASFISTTSQREGIRESTAGAVFDDVGETLTVLDEQARRKVAPAAGKNEFLSAKAPKNRDYWRFIYEKTYASRTLHDLENERGLRMIAGGEQSKVVYALERYGGRTQKRATPSIEDVIAGNKALAFFGKEVYSRLKEKGSLSYEEITDILKKDEDISPHKESIIADLKRLATPITTPKKILTSTNEIDAIDDGFAVHPHHPSLPNQPVEVTAQRDAQGKPIRRGVATRLQTLEDFDGIPVYPYATALLAKDAMDRWLMTESPRQQVRLPGWGQVLPNQRDADDETLRKIELPDDPTQRMLLGIEGKDDMTARRLLFHEAVLATERPLRGKISGKISAPKDLAEKDYAAQARAGIRLLTEAR